MKTRLRLVIRGAVQGVGFRPFLFRLASDLGLNGWVNNSAQGVFVEVEGLKPKLDQFLLRVEKEKPPRSSIQGLESSWLDTVGYAQFEIRSSDPGGPKTALVMPDIAVCAECLREVFDPNNRRYFYPFTNCTNCGPRFSIIEALPYDRANTSMKRFSMCPLCQAEYDDPRDRRFHAQPNACPHCGPGLALWDRNGQIREPPVPQAIQASPSTTSLLLLQAAAGALRAGQIVAVKGLGGFHLMVAANNEATVERLRDRKHREEKPFALMFPSVEAVKAVCEVSSLEERLLRSPEAPIVLLRRRSEASDNRSESWITPKVAPGNPYLGAMLAYTPLHHLLLSLLSFPVVATSGNLSDEPICTDEHEAVERLGGIAELFLVHNRPIVRHVDDSIARVMGGREMVLRRARGFAPLPIPLRSSTAAETPADSHETRNVLAVGAHLKNTIALSVGPQVFISQHIGDLETDRAFEAFRRVISDFEKLYETSPALVAADVHPDYLSTQFARSLVQSLAISAEGSEAKEQVVSSSTQALVRRSGLFIGVQHHLAHVLSCMAENDLKPPALGVSWDGTGYGLDDTVWGGEFFVVEADTCERVAHFRQFRLPGGERAIKEPRRSALGVLYELYGAEAFNRKDLETLQAFTPAELVSLKTMLARSVNSPLTSSAGRLFDAVASLAGLRHQTRFEGQAAMELEFAVETTGVDTGYEFVLAPYQASGAPAMPLVVDWSPAFGALLADLQQGTSIRRISAKFHNGLAEVIVAVARQFGLPQVLLSGGCFQNCYLTERAIGRLQTEGFRAYWHQRVPPNDGGIALGQIVAAQRGFD